MEVERPQEPDLPRERQKEQRCSENEIPMLVIPYWDYSRLPEILDDSSRGRSPLVSDPPECVRKYSSMRDSMRQRIEQAEEKKLQQVR